MVGQTLSGQPGALVVGDTLHQSCWASLPNKALCIAAAVMLPLQAKALTSDWEGSYSFTFDNLTWDVLNFKMKGELQNDKNTIYITSFSDVSVNGLPPIDWQYTCYPLPCQPLNMPDVEARGTRATTTIDGSYHDFLALTSPRGDGFYIWKDPYYSENLVFQASRALNPFGYGIGSTVTLLYDPTKWSLKAVGGTSGSADNVPGPLPILGLGVVFGFSRKLRKRIKRTKETSSVSTSLGT